MLVAKEKHFLLLMICFCYAVPLRSPVAMDFY